jgi:HD superfamily phosphohydrolase
MHGPTNVTFTAVYIHKNTQHTKAHLSEIIPSCLHLRTFLSVIAKCVLKIYMNKKYSFPVLNTAPLQADLKFIVRLKSRELWEDLQTFDSANESSDNTLLLPF